MVANDGSSSLGLWKNCSNGVCDPLSYGGEGIYEDTIFNADSSRDEGNSHLTPLLSCPCAHRRPQVSAGLHDPLHHLLCRLSRGLRVPALHHGERKLLLPLGGRHAGVL